MPVASNGRGFFARSTRYSAIALTIYRKFSSPTDARSASGAQFMKSIA